jgi:drug/metabolite transporter (DMT)-like permease
VVGAVFGLPAFLLARKYQLVNFWSLSFGGAGVAMLPLLVLWLINSGATIQTDTKSWPAFAVLGVCGFAVGVLFWLVAYYRPHNNRLVRTPGTTRHVS